MPPITKEGLAPQRSYAEAATACEDLLRRRIMDPERDENEPIAQRIEARRHEPAPAGRKQNAMTIEFRKTDPNDRARGKLAEGTLKFDDISYGALGGCAITGLDPTDGGETPRVTLPARVYSINGERRRFDLVRPADPDSSTEPLRDAIAAAWLRNGEKSGEVEL